MMRTPALVLSSLLVACTGLAACGDESIRISTTRDDGQGKGVLKVVQTLQCPQTQGSLTRKGTAQAGGTVCTYGGPRGSEVTLHLQPLKNASVDDVLGAFEDRLSRDIPETMAAIAASTAPRATPTGSGPDTPTTVEAPGVRVRAEGEAAQVKAPGLSINSDGERASIRIGGVTIDARDESARVNIEGGSDEGSVSIQAADDGALIRTRAAGDATRATWIVTDGQTEGTGWRMVGYEARGPAGGPLVIAVVRAKETGHDTLMDDAQALLTLNVGE